MAIKAPSTEDTKSFYDNLLQGKKSRGIWGADSRFNASRILGKPSVKKYFTDVLQPHLCANDTILDLGCGPGGFLAAVAPQCKEIVGCDISQEFISSTEKTIKEHGISNSSAILYDGETIPFNDNHFDKILLVDVLHHLSDPQTVIREMLRVLKPEGKLLIFEPNKFNPLLALMCALDRNEWGLLKLGTVATYRKLFSGTFNIELAEFNGLLIGPDSPSYLAIADFINSDNFSKLLGWLNPKLFIVASKS